MKGNNDKNNPIKAVASASSYKLKYTLKYMYGIVWVADSQIHQQYLCSLCSTMPLQYIPLILTDLKRKIKC